MQLNTAQCAAVSHRNGPCMVLAGPGSGKTMVITHRIAYLIREAGVKPENILVITFTHASAAEMKRRFLLLSGENGKSVEFGTFHSVFYKMLKTRRQFSENPVLSYREKTERICEAVSDVLPGTETDREFAAALLSEISAVKNGVADPETFSSKVLSAHFREVYDRYCEKISSERKIDFDDMLLRTKEMLISEPETLSYFRQKYRYILVDEFQDINRLQYEIVKMLALPENNLFIVGDDDQSIYGFRGSDPEIMLGFPKDYPKAREICLCVNYRSEEEIVSCAGKLIRHNRSRFKKEIRAVPGGKEAVGNRFLCRSADRESPEGRKHVEIGSFPDEEKEYERICADLNAYREQTGSFSGAAVLVRTNRELSRTAEKLTEKNIPFYMTEQTQNVFASPLCLPVFSYLNYTTGNRTRRNFLRFMNTPLRFIKRADLENETIELEKLKEQYEKSESRKWMAARIEYLIYQLSLLEKLSLPFAMVNYIRKGMEYDRYVVESCREKGHNEASALQVLDDLQESSKAFADLKTWYAHIAKYTREIEEKKKEEERIPENSVCISTMHAAKGLEYRLVIIPGLNEKNIPHEKSMSADGIEEERRLLYVGMTRAKENLRLYCTEEMYGKRTEKSRFIKEITGTGFLKI